MIFIVMKITTSQIQVSGNLCSCGEHKAKYNLKYSCGYTGHKYAFHQNLISRITFFIIFVNYFLRYRYFCFKYTCKLVCAIYVSKINTDLEIALLPITVAAVV